MVYHLPFVFFFLSFSQYRSKDHKSAEELSPRNITDAGQADFQWEIASEIILEV